MNRAPLREITQAELRCYRDDGVVCLRGLFDADWPRRLGEAVDRVMKTPGGRAREVMQPGRPGRFHMNVFMARWDPDFRALALASPAAEIAGRLMGSRSARFFYDQLFVKEPQTAAPTFWHHDLPFWPLRGEQIASVWLALTPVDRESSGVEYLAGSHRWGKFYRAITPDEDAYFSDPSLESCPDFSAPRDESRHRYLSFALEPGDVLVHHPLTVHGAGGNHSLTQRRAAVSVRYLGEDAVWDPRPATMPLPGSPSYPPGAPVVDEQRFPTVWQREG
jgi:ectoine hydroxylase-related dioxygenase (phytanoyl-CoA dioxygenase family)